jgi:hypothetical protein
LLQLWAVAHIVDVGKTRVTKWNTYANRGTMMRNSFNSVTDWLNKQSAKEPDAVVAASLQMAAHVRMNTQLAIVVHPHAENSAQRARGTLFYKLFGHTPVPEMHRIMRDKLQATYVVFDAYSCRRQCRIEGKPVGGYEYLVQPRSRLGYMELRVGGLSREMRCFCGLCRCMRVSQMLHGIPRVGALRCRSSAPL